MENTKFDVFSTHADILKKLNNKYNSLSSLKNNLADAEKIYNTSHDKLERIEANNKIFDLKREIRNISDKKEINNYLEKVEPILEGYKSSMPKKLSFLNTKSNDNNSEERKYFLLKFIKLAREYIDIGIVRDENEKKFLVCKNCKSTNFTYINDTKYCCEDCAISIDITDDTYSYKDIDRINLSSRYSYTKDGHFKEAMINFQCIQNVVIPQEIYDMIEREVAKHSIKIMTPKEIQDMIDKGTPRHKIKALTLDHVLIFLQENGYNDYYSDASLIYHTITKTKPPDIRKYEAELLAKLKLLEVAIEKVKDPERSSSLNVNFKLFKLLQSVGYPCKASQFAIPRTKSRLDSAMEVYEKACEYLEWPFIP